MAEPDQFEDLLERVRASIRVRRLIDSKGPQGPPLEREGLDLADYLNRRPSP